MKVLLVGAGAREHAIGRAIARSEGAELFVVAKHRNPGLAAIAKEYSAADEASPDAVVQFAGKTRCEWAVVGPEAPLAAGVSDALRSAGVSVAAPSRAAAEIETSKLFMRRLLQKHKVSGSLGFHHFEDVPAAKKELRDGNLRYAIKPIGLTGGKGVKVFGDHFNTLEEGVAYIEEVIKAGAGGHGVLLEELLEGEEFTVQAFADGTHLVPTIPVQDHKRLFENDEGPNTGGMGSYSQADGLLPFLPRQSWEESLSILRHVLNALKAEGRPYVGPIYGQFMLTNAGPRIIEINARFGDPEAINVLGLLRTDYADIIRRMVEGRVADTPVEFKHFASVVKYVVPPGYGVAKGEAGIEIHVDEAQIQSSGAEVCYASVDVVRPGVVRTTASRSLAILGRGETLAEANAVCERGLGHVTGRGLHVRHDIGTRPLIERKVKHMQLLAR